MSIYRRAIYPLLSRLEAEAAHDAAVAALAWAQDSTAGMWLLRRIAGEIPVMPVRIFGRTFLNPLGLAAGFDKNGRAAVALGELGFGHVEVGTITPRPQPGNPKPRIHRVEERDALINAMGFPNEGVRAVLPRLRRLSRMPRRCLLGVSLGKQKETALEDAARDYVQVMRRAYPFTDYLAVNISSPNTPGLRELQGGDYLQDLLRRLRAETDRLARRHVMGRTPILVKIAPDLDPAALAAIVDAAGACGMDGIIATNTTLSREGLPPRAKSRIGGMSGAPLRQRSTEIIRAIHRQAGSALPIIGVGGIASALDVEEKLDAGASLVQLYTALVYGGPGLPGRILRELRD